jgi:polyhydroxyalkanoate synthesis regulator phasin
LRRKLPESKPSRRTDVESSQSGGGGVRDQVQKAIDDLRAAGEKATGDVRTGIDDAVSRLRDVSGDASTRAQDQMKNWRETLDRATEDVRKELAKLAVRAQSSSQALDELSKEIDDRRQTLR